MIKTKSLYNKINKYISNIVCRTNADLILDKFGRGESFLDTICLLPVWFNESFNENTSNVNMVLLANSNLGAWIGYTIYDYIRDGKIPREKNIIMLSLANIMTQDSLISFINQTNNNKKREDIVKLFNTIDLYYIKQSLIKETDFKKLCSNIYKKSIAAATCAILTTPDIVYETSSKDIIDFFRFYFTARQLSDDLDDFKKDLKFKIHTPMTLLIKENKSIRESNLIMRHEIDLYFNKAIKSIKKVKTFDHENFIKKYMKPC